MDVKFYCINDNINSFIYDFLNKIINKNNQKILLYSSSLDKLKKFDEYLWISGNNSDFLPHCILDNTNNTTNDEKLLLTNETLNSKNIDSLVLSSFIDNTNFLNSFKNIYYIFTKSNDTSVEQARKSLNFFKQLNYNIIINNKDNTTKQWKIVYNF